MARTVRRSWCSCGLPFSASVTSMVNDAVSGGKHGSGTSYQAILFHLTVVKIDGLQE